MLHNNHQMLLFNVDYKKSYIMGIKLTTTQ